jgi:hypothetical protein
VRALLLTLLLFTAIHAWACDPEFLKRELRRPLRSTPAFTVLSEAKLSRFSGVSAVSDQHGNLNGTLRLLKNSNLANDSGDWAGGSHLLFVVGDLINKGPDSYDLVMYYRKLRQQARAAGGDIIFNLGNHETRLLADLSSAKKALKNSIRKSAAKQLLAEDSEFIRELDQLEIKGKLRKRIIKRIQKSGADKPKEIFEDTKLSDSATKRLANTIKDTRMSTADVLSWESDFIRFLDEASVATFAGDALFVHSGYLTRKSFNRAIAAVEDENYFYFREKPSLMESRGWGQDKESVKTVVENAKKLGVKRIFFGHDPEAFGSADIVSRKHSGVELIKLDAGRGNGRSGQMYHCESVDAFLAGDCVITLEKGGPSFLRPSPLKF